MPVNGSFAPRSGQSQEIRFDPRIGIGGDARTRSRDDSAARRSSHLTGGENGATIVLWNAAIRHTPASLTKTRRLSS
jgi:hypothetical protein